jgi:hypothetical protein
VTASLLRGVSTAVLLLGTACSAPPQPSTPVQPPTVAPASAQIAIDEDACGFLTADMVEAVLGRRVSLAEEHLSATPQSLARDCVYFGPGLSQALLTLSVRQEATSSVDAEAVIDGLREEYPVGASVSQVQVGAGFLGLGHVSATAFGYCWNGDSCWTSLAFGAAPHFFIVNVPRSIGGLQAAQTIADAVLENLGQ